MLILDETQFCIEAGDADIVEVLRSSTALNLVLPGIPAAPCEAFVVVVGRSGEHRVCSALYCKSRRTVHVFRLEAPVAEKSGYRAQLKDAKAFWEERGFHFETVKINYAKAMREVVIRALPVLMTPLAARKALAERNRSQVKLTRKELAVSNAELDIEVEFEDASAHLNPVDRCESEESACQEDAESIRKQAEEAARKQVEEAARRQTEEAIRRQTEEAIRRQTEEAIRKQAEEAIRKQAEEAIRTLGRGAAGESTEEDLWKKAEEAARRHVAEEIALEGGRGLAELQAEDRRLKKAEAEALKVAEAAARKKAEELRALSPEQRAAVIMQRESKEARVRVIVDEAATLLIGGHAETTDSASRRPPWIPIESFLLAPELETVRYHDQSEVAEVYSSLSMIVLSLEGFPPQHCSASICSLHRQGRVEIYVALRLRDSKRTLIYLPTRQPANMTEYRQIVGAAVRFLEVTGFLVEQTPLGSTPAERRSVLVTIPVLTLVGG